jgi:hypothetical protein
MTVFLRPPCGPGRACCPAEQSVTTRTGPGTMSMRTGVCDERQLGDDMAEQRATTIRPARSAEQARLVLRERPAAAPGRPR